jgi:hypothetical protein
MAMASASETTNIPPAEIAEIIAQLDKTTPGWRNAIRDVCDVQIPLPAYEITPPLIARQTAVS